MVKVFYTNENSWKKCTFMVMLFSTCNNFIKNASLALRMARNALTNYTDNIYRITDLWHIKKNRLIFQLKTSSFWVSNLAVSGLSPLHGTTQCLQIKCLAIDHNYSDWDQNRQGSLVWEKKNGHSQTWSLGQDINWRSCVLESNTQCTLKNILHFS